MPGRLDNAPYLSTGYPGTSVYTAPTAGGGGPVPRVGEVGKVYNDPFGRRWQCVKYAATLTQVAVASNLVYWKDVTTCTVDTDLTDSEGSRNTVAGFIAADATLPTAGQIAWVLQEQDQFTANGSTVNFLAGMKIVASATVGLVGGTAQATAAVDQVIATVHTAVDRSGGAGTVVIDVNIPSRLF